MASRDEARAAKLSLASRLGGLRDVRGVGLLVLKDGWAIRVNVKTDDVAVLSAIPEQVDGVPVCVRVVGETLLH